MAGIAVCAQLYLTLNLGREEAAQSNHVALIIPQDVLKLLGLTLTCFLVVQSGAGLRKTLVYKLVTIVGINESRTGFFESLATSGELTVLIVSVLWAFFMQKWFFEITLALALKYHFFLKPAMLISLLRNWASVNTIRLLKILALISVSVYALSQIIMGAVAAINPPWATTVLYSSKYALEGITFGLSERIGEIIVTEYFSTLPRAQGVCLVIDALYRLMQNTGRSLIVSGLTVPQIYMTTGGMILLIVLCLYPLRARIAMAFLWLGGYYAPRR